jgi:hypothetical protein
MKTRKLHRRCSYRILTVLAAFQPGGAHHQGPQQAHEDPGAGDEHFYNKYCKNYGVGGLEVQFYVKRRCHSCRRQARGRSTGSRRTSRRCGTRRSGLTAHLTTAFWTILCVAFLSYRSVQSLTTKSRTWSRRWGHWWAPLTGTPWQRPARSSGPGSRLLSPMAAISLNILILNTSLC